MKNKIKHLLTNVMAVFLAFLMLVSSAGPALALTPGQTIEVKKSNLVNAGFSRIYYSVKSGVDPVGIGKGKASAWCDVVSLFQDATNDKPLYCIQPYQPSASGTYKAVALKSSTYWNKELTDTATERISRFSLYLYPYSKTSYKNDTEKKNYRLASQVLLCEAVMGLYMDSDNNPQSSEMKGVLAEGKSVGGCESAAAAHRNIVKRIKSLNKKPSFASATNTPTAKKMTFNASTKKYSLTLKDNNGVLSDYTVKSNDSHITCSVSGNTLTLTSSTPITSTATITLTKKGTTTNDAATVEKKDHQVLFGGRVANPVYGYVRVYSEGFGSLKLKKLNEANQNMSGIKFNITNKTLGYSVQKTTNSSGVITVDNLRPGYTYTVTEVLPSGYKTPDWDIKAPSKSGTGLTASFTVETGKTTEITFTNYRNDPAYIEIIKQDTDSGVQIAGAEYSIYKTKSDAINGTNVVDKLVSKTSGKTISKPLDPGTYYIKETKAPAGYFLDSTIFQAILPSNVRWYRPFDDTTKGIIQISKTDSKYHNALEGAEFTIYSDSSCSTSVGTYTTDVDGVAVSDPLKIDTYYIKETKAPVGYQINDKVEKVELKAGSIGEYYVAQDSVKKTVDLSEALAPVYELGLPSSSNVDDMQPDSVDSDMYYIAGPHSETGNYIAYNNLEQSYSICLNGAIYKCFVTSEKATDNEVEQYKWYVYNTDKYVKANVSNIALNDSTFGTVYCSDLITELEKSLEKTTSNIEYKTASAEVSVKDTSNTPLAGVKIDAYIVVDDVEKYVASAVTGNKSTNSEGYCTFDGLAVGYKYIFKESIDSDSRLQSIGDPVYDASGNEIGKKVYKLNDTKLEATFDTENETKKLSFVNEASTESSGTTYVSSFTTVSFEDKANEVVIHKSDLTTAESISGALITIYNEDNTIFISNSDHSTQTSVVTPEMSGMDDYATGYMTNIDGDITIYAIPAGKYTFVETIAPEGYLPAMTETDDGYVQTVFEFTVNPDGTITGDTEVKDAPTKLKITKKDVVSEDFVKDAEYAFYNTNGQVVANGVTDENGKIVINKLPVGKYTYREVKAPEGYKLDPTTYEIEIMLDGTLNGTTEVSDEPITILITKTDEEENLLPGATFTFYNENGDEIATETTNSFGSIELSYIPVGTYHYKEVVAPLGFKLSANEYTFNVTEDGTVTGETTVVDVLTSVTIQKVDSETNKGLAGAVIEIYDEEGNIVNESNNTTDKDGYITLVGLPVGKYTYKETLAPDGYSINKNTFSFEILADGSIVGDTILEDDALTIVPDEPVDDSYEVVKTGTNLFIALGLVAFSAAGMIVLRVLSKKEND